MISLLWENTRNLTIGDRRNKETEIVFIQFDFHQISPLRRPLQSFCGNVSRRFHQRRWHLSSTCCHIFNMIKTVIENLNFREVFNSLSIITCYFRTSHQLSWSILYWISRGSSTLILRHNVWASFNNALFSFYTSNTIDTFLYRGVRIVQSQNKRHHLI